MTNKPCPHVTCRSNAMSSPGTKRFRQICLAEKCEFASSPAVNRMLNFLISKFPASELTDQELAYCLSMERRPGGQKKLTAEQRRREKARK